MDKTSQAAGLNLRLLCAAAITITIAFAGILTLLPVHALEEEPPASLEPGSNKDLNNRRKDCFTTDPNGRKWPCSRFHNHTANRTMFKCSIENRMGVDIKLACDNVEIGGFFILRPGETAATKDQIYQSTFDPAPPTYVQRHTSPNVTCEWWCAGNKMEGVVVWNEQWSEAWSCRTNGGNGQCKIVFESNRVVVLDTRAERRVLGDLAIKECSKNLWGYGGWLPFGLGCTYPKHEHAYYGSIA